MRTFILSLLAVFLALSFCRAQVPSTVPFNGVVPAVFNVAGGTYDAPNSYYRFEWSFGEMLMIESYANADSTLILTQGVLQPCTDKITKSPHVLIFDKGDYSLFPNPTQGQFEVNFFVRTAGRMSLQLIDATGRILEKRQYDYNGCCRIEHYDITRYPDGVYYVIADLKPFTNRPGDNLEVVRHSGFTVIKVTPK